MSQFTTEAAGASRVAGTHPQPERKDLSSPSSVLDRHSQNAARSFYRRALIAAILQATGKPLQTPAFVEVGVMSEAIRSATIIAAARVVMLMSGLFMALVPMSAQTAEICRRNRP